MTSDQVSLIFLQPPPRSQTIVEEGGCPMDVLVHHPSSHTTESMEMPSNKAWEALDEMLHYCLSDVWQGKQNSNGGGSAQISIDGYFIFSTWCNGYISFPWTSPSWSSCNHPLCFHTTQPLNAPTHIPIRSLHTRSFITPEHHIVEYREPFAYIPFQHEPTSKARYGNPARLTVIIWQ